MGGPQGRRPRGAEPVGPWCVSPCAAALPAGDSEARPGPRAAAALRRWTGPRPARGHWDGAATCICRPNPADRRGRVNALRGCAQPPQGPPARIPPPCPLPSGPRTPPRPPTLTPIPPQWEEAPVPPKGLRAPDVPPSAFPSSLALGSPLRFPVLIVPLNRGVLLLSHLLSCSGPACNPPPPPQGSQDSRLETISGSRAARSVDWAEGRGGQQPRDT